MEVPFGEQLDKKKDDSLDKNESDKPDEKKEAKLEDYNKNDENKDRNVKVNTDNHDAEDKSAESEEEVFLGRSVSQKKTMSDETAKVIDSEIRILIENAENHARKVLKKNIKHLHALSNALLEYETLNGQEVNEIIKGKKIKTNDSTKTKTKNKTSMPRSLGSGKISIDPQPAVGS